MEGKASDVSLENFTFQLWKSFGNSSIRKFSEALKSFKIWFTWLDSKINLKCIYNMIINNN